MPATPNEHAEQSKKSDETDASTLARELVALEGAPHQFEMMVTQILDAQRQIGTHRIMSKPGATRDNISSSMTALDSALEKIELNLRSQYADYVDAHVAFKTSNLSLGDLSDFVQALRSESIQRYFARMRSVQDDARHFFQRLAQTMLKRAIGA